MSYTVAVSSQECTNTVGSLSHNSNFATQDHTFILSGYTVLCNGTVVAWELCYRISTSTSVTFYPGIWRITGTSRGVTHYELVQSNNVTYDQTIFTSSIDTCWIFNLSAIDQFTAPAGSVVGLYSGVRTSLLHDTNTNNSVTTYRRRGNESSFINAGSDDDVNYNIAIRVHLGMYVAIVEISVYVQQLGISIFYFYFPLLFFLAIFSDLLRSRFC